MSTTINTTAGKQIGELARTYEMFQAVLEQATIKRAAGIPIVTITVATPLPGDPGGIAASVAALMTASSQEALDIQFVNRLTSQLAAVSNSFNAQAQLVADATCSVNPPDEAS